MSRLKKTAHKPGMKSHQKGRQQGSQTTGEARFSNDQQFYRHPGQGMRGEQGGEHEAE